MAPPLGARAAASAAFAGAWAILTVGALASRKDVEMVGALQVAEEPLPTTGASALLESGAHFPARALSALAPMLAARGHYGGGGMPTSVSSGLRAGMPTSPRAAGESPTGALAARANAAEPAEAGGRVKIQVMNLNAKPHFVPLPDAWATRLDLSAGAELIRSSWHGDGFGTVVYRAKEAKTGHEVAFKVLQNWDPRATREVIIRTAITEFFELYPERSYYRGWGVIPNLGACGIGEETYLFMPAADESLHTVMDSYRSGGFRDRTRSREAEPECSAKMLVPLHVSLPIIADVLQGLILLEEVGIWYGDLTARDVLVQNGRALITDFGSSDLDGSWLRYVDPMQKFKRPTDLDGDFLGSPFTHAPEMIVGRPTGPENAVWAVGLLMVEMSFGFNPTLSLSTRETAGAEWSWIVRTLIRKQIRMYFDIRESPEIRGVRLELASLIKGMLKKDPEQRLDARGALSMVKVAAESLGVRLPCEPPELLPRESPSSNVSSAKSW